MKTFISKESLLGSDLHSFQSWRFGVKFRPLYKYLKVIPARKLCLFIFLGSEEVFKFGIVNGNRLRWEFQQDWTVGSG